MPGIEKMSGDAAHKSWWQIFEVVTGIPFLVAIALQQIIPIRFPYEFPIPAIIGVGVLFIIIGVSVVVLARREFVQYGQPTDPGLPTGKIITTGIFAISRNPLYLGGIFLLAGISLAFNLPWVLILLVPSIAGCHYLLIVPEEKYLADRFGEQYQEYIAKVHRWIGR